MRTGLCLVASFVALLTGLTPTWADDKPPATTAASDVTAPRFQVSVGVGLGSYGRSDGHFGPPAENLKSSSPTMLCLCAHLMGELQLGGGVWLGVAVRKGTLAAAPIQDEVRVDGNYFGAELGVTYRWNILALRLAAGTSYLDAHWVFIGADNRVTRSVSSWGIVIRPELALEFGPPRGWSFALATGASRTFLVDADNPFDERRLSLSLGNRF